MTIDVLVELKLKKVDKTFTYSVPKDLEEQIKIGIRVLVPFGKQKLEGFVLKINNNLNPSFSLKDILMIIDKHSVLNKEMLELGVYISKKTLSPLISCYQLMLPSALKAKKNVQVNKKYVVYLKLNNDIDLTALTNKQKQIIDLFKENDRILKKEATLISSSITKTLLSKGIIVEYKEEVYRLNGDIQKKKSTIKLNASQTKVVNEVISNMNLFKPYLLFYHYL